MLCFYFSFDSMILRGNIFFIFVITISFISLVVFSEGNRKKFLPGSSELLAAIFVEV